MIFALGLVYSLRRNEQKKIQLEDQEKEIARKLYQTQVLQEISEKIGYSLNIRTVTETLVGALNNLNGLSTISYCLIENREIVGNILMKEAVGEKYLGQITNRMVASLYSLDDSSKGYKVSLTNSHVDDMKSYIALHFDPSPESYFNVPLVVNNTCLGVITLSSRSPHAFAEADIDMVYSVVKQATKAIEQLEAVIQGENSRLINLVSSLPTPAILFAKEGNTLKVSAANAIASQILKLPSSPSFEDIVFSMEGQVDLPQLVGNVYGGQISVFLKDVLIKEKTYKFYLNPVYNINNSEVVGVTLSLMDVTLEVESEKMREKFTNMVVHELRAPMTSIKGGAGLLLKGTVKGEDADKMLHIISDSSERMLSQINDLLDAAKLEAGKFAVAPELADMNELVKTRVEAFSYLASTKQITLENRLDSSLTAFVFDKMRIDQVLMNLLSNSLKFTQANGRIVISTKKEGGMVTVSVTDNGMGIPAGKQNLLFVPFSQMQSAFRRDGTGLGLYISRGIVESHGGKIWMSPNQGAGTTVAFSLPTNIKPMAEPLVTPAQSPVHMPVPLVNKEGKVIN